MRFLLKSAGRSAGKAPPNTTRAPVGGPSSAGKAWGQQCSPSCGCVLRIETELVAASPAAASPTVVRAAYHAKRVVATLSRGDGDGDGDAATRPYLTPLTARRGGGAAPRPMLAPCACPSLHSLARRTVEHLPGKTLAQLRNAANLGAVGSRSTVAFRHTVLRETVLPEIATQGRASGSTKINWTGEPEKDVSNDRCEHVMDAPQTSCYDLVEDALLSLIHERAPHPRRDTDAEAHSPTLGGAWSLYSDSQRHVAERSAEDARHDAEETTAGAPRLSQSPHLDADWHDRAPASSFPFGRDGDAEATSLVGTLLEQIRESLGNLGAVMPGSGVASPGEAMSTSFSKRHDAHGTDHSHEEVEESARKDWLHHVDEMHSENQSSAG